MHYCEIFMWRVPVMAARASRKAGPELRARTKPRDGGVGRTASEWGAERKARAPPRDACETSDGGRMKTTMPVLR